MKIIAINKISSKLKDWSVEMPNAPYSNRYGSLTIAVNYYHVAETENQEWKILFQYINLKVAILNLRKICL
jgi:hypothetical protein